MYLLTCEYINISGIFEVTDKTICFEHKCTNNQLQKAKKELEAAKLVMFRNGWIKVFNAEKNNRYRNSPKNEIAYNKELSRVPRDIISEFDTSMDSSMHTNHKPEIINNKEGSVRETKKSSKEDITSPTFKDYLKATAPFSKYSITDDVLTALAEKIDAWATAKGKVVKDWKATARKWLLSDIEAGKIGKRQSMSITDIFPDLIKLS